MMLARMREAHRSGKISLPSRRIQIMSMVSWCTPLKKLRVPFLSLLFQLIPHFIQLYLYIFTRFILFLFATRHYTSVLSFSFTCVDQIASGEFQYYITMIFESFQNPFFEKFFRVVKKKECFFFFLFLGKDNFNDFSDWISKVGKEFLKQILRKRNFIQENRNILT